MSWFETHRSLINAESFHNETYRPQKLTDNNYEQREARKSCTYEQTLLKSVLYVCQTHRINKSRHNGGD